MIRNSLKTIINSALKPAGLRMERIPAGEQQDAANVVKSTPFYVPAATCQIPELATLFGIFFGEIANGCFVEVGAFDGDSFSNTSCLADMGWRGFYIEPVPASFEKCRLRHAGNVGTKVFNIAIGAEESEIVLSVGGPLSTANNEILGAFKKLSWTKESFSEQTRAKQITLDAFLATNGVPPQFDLLIVDVEGYESNVFAGFNLAKYRPKMLIVELAETHPDFPDSRQDNAKLFEAICSHGYYVVYKDAINTVFVSQDQYRKAFANS